MEPRQLPPIPMAQLPFIQSYGSDGFRIAGQEIPHAVLILSDAVYPLETLSLEGVSEALCAPCWDRNPPLEVLLLGTGATHHRLPTPLREAFKARGLAVDAMATGAAARTFNVLLSEDRRVAALLLLV